MFDLDTQQVKLASVNARAELHGDDPKPAFDLKIEATLSSEKLIHFHPELRQFFFKKDDAPDLVDQVNGETMTALRFPKMGSVKWDIEYSGYSATVGYGIGGKSDIQLGDVKVDHFRFEPMNGGSVLITFRIIAHPETADVGKLCEFIQQNIDLTLTPPEAATPQELFKDAEQTPAPAAKKPMTKAEKKEANLAAAEAEFIKPAATAKPVLAPAEAWPFPTKSH